MFNNSTASEFWYLVSFRAKSEANVTVSDVQ